MTIQSVDVQSSPLSDEHVCRIVAGRVREIVREFLDSEDDGNPNVVFSPNPWRPGFRIVMRCNRIITPETSGSSCDEWITVEYGYFQWERKATLTVDVSRNRGLEAHRCGRSLDGIRAEVTEWVEDRGVPIGQLGIDTFPSPWDELWEEDATVKWLIEGVIEEGCLHALFGPPKCGKSLLALDWSLDLIGQGKRILYLDEENPRIEVRRRIQDMGRGPKDLRLLDHHSFESLTVDTEEGAEKIVQLASDGYDLIVFDSWARFFASGNQSSDVGANFAYANVLKPLASQGVAVLRLDHTGHDGARPSGTIVKLADITHGWRINTRGSAVTLTHTENRTGRGVEHVRYVRELGPLRHVRQGPAPVVDLPEAGRDDASVVSDATELLDSLSVPVDWPRERVADFLRKAGHGMRSATLAAAIRARRQA